MCIDQILSIRLLCNLVHSFSMLMISQRHLRPHDWLLTITIEADVSKSGKKHGQTVSLFFQTLKLETKIFLSSYTLYWWYVAFEFLLLRKYKFTWGSFKRPYVSFGPPIHAAQLGLAGGSQPASSNICEQVLPPEPGTSRVYKSIQTWKKL